MINADIGLFLIESKGSGVKRFYAETPINLALGEKKTIGRYHSPRADISCQFANGESKAISTLHATIERVENGWYIYDGDGHTPSRNGIFVKDRRIQTGLLLSENNDVLHLLPLSKGSDFLVFLKVRDTIFAESLEKTASLEDTVNQAKKVVDDNNTKLTTLSNNVNSIMQILESASENSETLIDGSNTLLKVSLRVLPIAAIIIALIWVYTGGLTDLAKFYLRTQNYEHIK